MPEEERGERNLILRETTEIKKNNDLNFLQPRQRRKRNCLLMGANQFMFFKENK